MCSLIESPPSCRNLFIDWQPSQPSLYIDQREEEDGEGGRNCIEPIDNLLNGSRLILSGEFEEVREDCSIPAQLYLTNKELIIATRRDKGLVHERTHSLRETDIRSEENDTLIVTARETTFHYKLKQVSGGCINPWLQKITSLKITSLQSNDLPVCTIASVQTCPIVMIQHPSQEWLNDSMNSSHSDNLITSSPSSITLKRSKAFRGHELKRFRFNKSRSSSAPPEKDNVIDTTSPQTSSSEHLLSPDSPKHKSIFVTSSAPSSLRKKRLKFSPHARKFTRALSARLMNTPLILTSSSAHSSPKLRKKEFQRGHSFHSDFSTASLPRSLPNKYVRKNHSVLYSNDTPEPVIPVTPTRLRSGNLFKLFQRRRVTPLSVPEQVDSSYSTSDLFNKPNINKLYFHNPKAVAEELVVIDSELFRKIQVCELMNGAWTKTTKHSTSPNVLQMIESFNLIARVVCTEIVHEKSIHARVKAISTYIQMARSCYRVHNYNSLKAIISGLQSQPVYRLTRSWNQVPSRRRKKFDKLSQLCSDLDNGQLQDEMLYNLQRRIQCIPYLGWLLTSILHKQVYDKLRKTRSSSVSGQASKQWRASVCSISMPTSPLDHQEEEEEERVNIIVPSLSPISFTHPGLSKSLCDIYSSNDYPLIQHPLTNDHYMTPPPCVSMATSGHFTRKSSVSDSDDNSLKTDSAIGLDSSMSQVSPNKRNIKLMTHNEEENYSLPSIGNTFDSDDSEEEEEERGTIMQQTSFTTATTISSSSSTSTSLLSPSMITLSITSPQTKRRSTLPHLQSLPSRASSVYYDFTCGGILFSSCSIPRDYSSTSIRLSAVARQLLLEEEELVAISSDTPSVQTENAIEDCVSHIDSPVISNDSTSLECSSDANVFILFEQYQVNTLNYLTEYCSNSNIRRVICNSVWVDDKQCHTISMQVEPNPL